MTSEEVIIGLGSRLPVITAEEEQILLVRSMLIKLRKELQPLPIEGIQPPEANVRYSRKIT